MEPTAEPDPHMPETSKRKWNRPRIAAWAGAIVLSICIPVAIDQAYFRYNAYILPIVGLLVVLVYGGLIVTMHGISTKIHTFHQGFGIAHPWKYILTISVCGGIVILLLVSGEWYAVQKSKDHVATLRKHDS